MNLAAILYDLGQWAVSVSEAYPWLGPLLVFLVGVVTALNPCSIAALPLMLGFILGQGERDWKKALLLSLAFVVGLSLVLTVFGVVVQLLKQSVNVIGIQTYGSYVVGVVLIVAGIWLMDVLPVRIPMFNLAKFRHRGVVGAFLLGMLFSLVALPCAGPFAFAIAALSGDSIVYGTLLFFIYSLGTGAIVVLVGVSAGLAQNLVSSERLSRFNKVFRIAGGVLFVFVGLYFLVSPFLKG